MAGMIFKIHWGPGDFANKAATAEKKTLLTFQNNSPTTKNQHGEASVGVVVG